MKYAALLIPMFVLASPAASVTIDDYRCTGAGSPSGLVPPCTGAETTYDAAFRRAIGSFPYTNSTDYRVGGEIVLKAQTYAFAATINIDRNVVVRGEGGSGENGGSRLVFASGGIVVNYLVQFPPVFPPVECSAVSPTCSNGGSASLLRDLVIQSTASSGAADGVALRGTAIPENVWIDHFRGNGVRAEACAACSPATNSNQWRLENVRVTNSGAHGLFVDGPDTGTGTAIGLEVSSNAGWGVFDSTFIGTNTYVGAFASGNGAGGFTTDRPAARNIFLNCTALSDQPPSSLVYSSIVVGGSIPLVNSTAGALLGGTKVTLPVATRFMNNLGDAGTSAIGSLGSVNTTGSALEFYSTTYAQGFSWRLQYNDSTKSWDLRYAGLGTGVAMALSTSATPEGSGQLWLPNGLWSGPATAKMKSNKVVRGSTSGMEYNINGVIHFKGWNTVAPASGTFSIGDVVLNTGSGANRGWRHNGTSWTSF